MAGHDYAVFVGDTCRPPWRIRGQPRWSGPAECERQKTCRSGASRPTPSVFTQHGNVRNGSRIAARQYPPALLPHGSAWPRATAYGRVSVAIVGGFPKSSVLRPPASENYKTTRPTSTLCRVARAFEAAMSRRKCRPVFPKRSCATAKSSALSQAQRGDLRTTLGPILLVDFLQLLAPPFCRTSRVAGRSVAGPWG